MGKGRPRAVEKGGSGKTSSSVLPNGFLNVPPAPVYYPTEDEFRDPLDFIYKIRAEAEPYGMCKIIPPEGWKPPFALDLNSFTFPTKTQAIHQLQARPASCDSKTFDLEYTRFLEDHQGKKTKKRVVFEGEELDLCKLFNAVKRFGGYDKVLKDKKWGEVFRFVRSGAKISECAKHVLSQLYREHLYDYEEYYSKLNDAKARNCCKRGARRESKGAESSSNKKRRKNNNGDSVKVPNVEKEEPQDVDVDQTTPNKGSESSNKKRRKNNNGDSVKVPKVEKKKENEDGDQICEQCNSGLHGEVMLLCDRCNKGWHIYCLSPPLEAIPPGNWYCFDCLNSDKDAFGFVPGKQFSLEAFRKFAERAKKKWFGSNNCSRMQVEKKFWEIVEGSLGEVEVMYGSDLDTSVFGSGFPRIGDKKPDSVEAEAWEKYCASPWNLNNLPKLKGSMLQAVHHNIAGVMVPWLYIGMLFSAFCWHFEDHCFYSMNYHHWGEPKCWYSVPGNEASAFEKVMRSCLPDLFDAQPDLLFQLVTMLNPFVLQENGVPVYTVLQEPGNFVITFPRSYHGGFNFGLNCAEAVNFAPADWLPYGGFASEHYQLFHKAAVLSHEELLCVVAKQSGLDSRTSPYLNKELVRIFSKEKMWRERLWKKGMVKTSPMSPRKHPEYVGTKEDPTCVICQQYLYLSAVVCRCRSSTYVCLEHSEHLCECTPRKQRLLYRHSLAELDELVLLAGDNSFDNMSLRRQNSNSAELGSLTKKVKNRQVSFAQLAEQWLLSSCKIVQLPFAVDLYSKALKEAEQFLWAGSEMEPVRDMAKNLAEAKTWVESVRDCLSRIEGWPTKCRFNAEKVRFEKVAGLIMPGPLPCIEPGHKKLKDYVEAAEVLTQEIQGVLAKSPVSISAMEELYTRACDVPIHVKESETLLLKLTSVKACLDNVGKCASEKSPASIAVDFLRQLISEMVVFKVEHPESETLLNLMARAELCQARCNQILNGPISVKNLEVLIEEFEDLTVDVPELRLLRQYHSDTVSWISRFSNLIDISGREDHDTVDELKCLQEEGKLLKVDVDELKLVEVELKRACCRKKALEARGTKMTLDFIQQVLSEAAMLQIDKGKLFSSIYEVLSAARSWEQQAEQILGTKARLLEFEKAIRTAEEMPVVLPSLSDLRDAKVTAEAWLEHSRPFLENSDPGDSSSTVRSFDVLKERAFQSKALKVSLAEQMVVESILKNCEDWKQSALSVLEDLEGVLNVNDVEDRLDSDFVIKIEQLISRAETAMASGLSLRFDLLEISKLERACSTLKWCFKVLSCCSSTPSLQVINGLSEAVNKLATGSCGDFLRTSLICGISWLKKATEVISVANSGRKMRRFRLADAEDVFREYQNLKVPFPAMVKQLENAMEKHKAWLDKAQNFFAADIGERSLPSLLELKEQGKMDAFKCPELDMVISEADSIGRWRLRTEEVVGSVGDVSMMSSSLLKIKQSLHRSLYIYEKSKGWKVSYFCTGCSNNTEDEEFITCGSCKDCYHLRCMDPRSAGKISKEYICPYCLLVESGSICRSGDSPLRYEGKRPQLKTLIELVSDAEKFRVWVEERDVLQDAVDEALACRGCLTEIVDSALTYLDQDIFPVSRKLTIALKALDVAGVEDSLASQKFDIALSRNSWRVRAFKLMDGPQKPPLQQIQRQLKEALTVNIPPEDYFRQKLVDIKQTGMRWAETAKKVSMDKGEMELHDVFDLIAEGENLPVLFEKEMKQLQVRGVLYCICRKPYDQRSMIACDECDEWYHFDCVNLVSAPKTYICPACAPQAQSASCSSPSTKQERLNNSVNDGEPQTPSPRPAESRWRSKKAKKKQKKSAAADSRDLWFTGGVDSLLWKNRKRFRRVAKRRSEMGSLAPFFSL